MHRVWRKKSSKGWTLWWYENEGLLKYFQPYSCWYDLIHCKVRELTGGIYFGTPKGIETDPVTGVRKGFSTGVYTDLEIERIAKVALDTASKRKGKLCSVDKVYILITDILCWNSLLSTLYCIQYILKWSHSNIWMRNIRKLTPSILIFLRIFSYRPMCWMCLSCGGK